MSWSEPVFRVEGQTLNPEPCQGQVHVTLSVCAAQLRQTASPSMPGATSAWDAGSGQDHQACHEHGLLWSTDLLHCSGSSAVSGLHAVRLAFAPPLCRRQIPRALFPSAYIHSQVRTAGPSCKGQLKCHDHRPSSAAHARLQHTPSWHPACRRSSVLRGSFSSSVSIIPSRPACFDDGLPAYTLPMLPDEAPPLDHGIMITK